MVSPFISWTLALLGGTSLMPISRVTLWKTDLLACLVGNQDKEGLELMEVTLGFPKNLNEDQQSVA